MIQKKQKTNLLKEIWNPYTKTFVILILFLFGLKIFYNFSDSVKSENVISEQTGSLVLNDGEQANVILKKTEIGVLLNKKERTDAVITPENNSIKKITIEGVQDTSQLNNIQVDAQSDNLVKIYAVNPEGLNYTKATFQVQAQGKSLMKCKDWDFENSVCKGRWKKIQSITPGEDYNFTVYDQDPGFGESNDNVNLLTKDGLVYYTNETILSNDSDTVDVRIDILENASISEIIIYDKNASQSNDIILDENVSTPQFTKEFVLNPSDVQFSTAVVKSVAQGNSLFKCVDWDSNNSVCTGRWKKVRSVTPGEEYDFTITATDPGFGEGNDTINVLDKDDYLLDYTETILNNDSGLQDVEIVLENSTIEQMIIYDHNDSSGKDDLKFDDVVNDTGAVKSYAINPVDMDFTELTFTITASEGATKLLKCVDWNFTTQECFGEWVEVMDLVSGESYNFTINSTDPAFRESIQDNSKVWDTYLRQDGASANTNFGDVTELDTEILTAKVRSSLLKFNLSNIPSTAVVSSAVLNVYMYTAPGVSYNVSAYRMTRDWTELGVTWNKYDGTNAWTTAGGDYNNSIEYARAALGTTGNVWISFNITPLVQKWVNGTNSNYGLILVSNDTNAASQLAKFYSTDYGTNTSRRPILVVDYTAPFVFSFVSPTPENNSKSYLSYTLINLSITNGNTSNAILEWNGVNYTMTNASASPSSSWYYNKTGLTPGTYTYKVYANDSVRGVFDVSETRTYTVDYSTPVETMPFFMSSDGLRASNGGGSESAGFSECPVQLNDYGNVTSKCELWDCTAWTPTSANDVPAYCSGGWSCTTWNGSTCSNYQCNAWSEGTAQYAKYCSGGFDCTSWNGGVCSNWNCLGVSDSTATKDAYCSGQWQCTSWNGAVCDIWNCTTWDVGATADRDVYCSGDWDCTVWNGNSCGSWNCTAWTVSGTSDADVYCRDGWNCTAWNGVSCDKWDCLTPTVGTAQKDFYCDRWNCSNWDADKKVCQKWSCLEWNGTGTSRRNYYCSGSFNCTTWKTFVYDTTPPATVTNLANQSADTTWIYWNWTNPADADFNKSIIYINGINAANTSNNYYNATGLTQNTNYTITINTVDNLGNVNTTNVSNTAKTLIDNSTLFVSPISPANNSLINTSSVSFQFNATSTVYSTVNCSLYLDSALNATNSSVLNATATTFAVTGINSGSHTWFVNCSDGTLTKVTTTRNFTVDTILPSISLNYPINWAVSNSTAINFNWTATDNLASTLYCNLTIDGVVNASNISAANNTPTNYTVTNLAKSSHNWSIKCWDAVNNTNTSSTGYFQIKKDIIIYRIQPIVIENDHLMRAGISIYNPNNFSVTVSNVKDTWSIDKIISGAAGLIECTPTCTANGSDESISWSGSFAISANNYQTFDYVVDLNNPGTNIFANVTTSTSEGNRTVQNVSIKDNIAVAFSTISTDNTTFGEAAGQFDTNLNLTFYVRIREEGDAKKILNTQYEILKIPSNWTSLGTTDSGVTINGSTIIYKVPASFRYGYKVFSFYATSPNVNSNWLFNGTLNGTDEGGAVHSDMFELLTVTERMGPIIKLVSPTDCNATVTRNSSFINVTYDHLPNWTNLEFGIANESLSGSGLNYYKNKTGLANGNYTFKVWANDSEGNMAQSSTCWVYINVTNATSNVTTDMWYYDRGQTVVINGTYWGTSNNITINVKYNGTSITGYPTTVMSSASGTISNSFVLASNASNGNYAVTAYVTSNPSINSSSIFEVASLHIYPAGTLLIPMDAKQNIDPASLDFLRAYGMVWRFTNKSYVTDMIITPPCYKLSAKNYDTEVNYNEDYCNGFFVLESTSAWSYLPTLRTMNIGGIYPFANITIHNVTTAFGIKEEDRFVMPRPPKIAVLSGSEDQITPTFDPSYMPYTLLTDVQIKAGVLNISTYDFLAIGHITIDDAVLAQKIKDFVADFGNVHAECVGATTLDSYTGFVGNVVKDGGALGNMQIFSPDKVITQTHVSSFDNEKGAVPTFDVSSAVNNFTTLAIDDNFLANNKTAKLIETYYGNGYVTYAGGHLGDRTGGLETPRNRILDNIAFWSIEVNDIQKPFWDNQNQSKDVVNSTDTNNLWAYLHDYVELNMAVLSTNASGNWTNVSVMNLSIRDYWINLSGRDIWANFTYNFTNLSANTVVGWKIYFNDSAGNTNVTDIMSFRVTDMPAVSLIGPANNSNDSNGLITFSYNVTGYSNISQCQLVINNTVNQTAYNITRDITNTFNYSRQVNGVISWYVNCTNIYGNSNPSETRLITIIIPPPILTITFNETIDSFNGTHWYATVDYIDALSQSIDYQRSGTIRNASMSSGVYYIRITPLNNPIKEILFVNVSLGDNITKLIDIDDPAETSRFIASVYALDLSKTSFNYSYVNVTVQATGRTLYKCAAWNYTAQNCSDDRWKRVRALIPGYNYTITLYNSTDPGFGEDNRSINVLTNDDYLVENNQTILNEVMGVQNVSIHLINHQVENITVYRHNTTTFLDDIHLDMPSTNYTNNKLFVINPTTLDFTTANITLKAVNNSNTVYKCLDWNYTSNICNDICENIDNETVCSPNMGIYREIAPGEYYSFVINATDPAFIETSEAVDVSITPINYTTFIVSWVNRATNAAVFKIMNTNGSTIVNTTVVDSTVDAQSRVSVKMINSTHFAIAWIDGPDNDATFAIYNLAGSVVVAATDANTNVKDNTDISVAEFGDRFAVCYADDNQDDASFNIYYNNGTQAVAVTDIDTDMSPEASLQNLVECSAINSTRLVYGWFDDQANDAKYGIVSETGSIITAGTSLDTNVGEQAQVDVAALDNDKFAYAYYDNEGAAHNIAIAIRYVNNTVILAPTVIDATAGTESRVAISAIRANSTSTSDMLVVTWWNQASSNIKAAVYTSSGTQVTAPFVVDTQQDTTYRLIDVTARESSTANSICPGRFIIAYTNSSDQGIYKAYYLNGTVWDGVSCPYNDIPAVNITHPTAGQNFSLNAVVQINATVTDNDLVSVVLANVTLPNGTSTLYTMTSVGSNVYTYNFTSTASLGAYNVTIIANDTLNNINNTQKVSFNVKDTVAPIITATAAVPNPMDYQQLFNITANVTEDINLSVVWFTLNNTNYTMNCSGNSSANFTCYYGLQANLTAGTYNYTVYANDTSGNNATPKNGNFTVNILVSIDVTQIPVNFTSVNAGAVVNASATQGFPAYVKNIGNVNVNVTLAGKNLTGQADVSYIINVMNVVYDVNVSFPTNTTLKETYQLLKSNLAVDANTSVYFRLYAPLNVKSQNYKGNVTFKAEQS